MGRREGKNNVLENISKLILEREFYWFIKLKPSGMWGNESQWKQKKQNPNEPETVLSPPREKGRMLKDSSWNFKTSVV